MSKLPHKRPSVALPGARKAVQLCYQAPVNLYLYLSSISAISSCCFVQRCLQLFITRLPSVAAMVFGPPSWVGKLPFDPPDSISIGDFVLDEKYGRAPLNESLPPFTCGLSGLEYTTIQVKERVDHLARALSKELGWRPNAGTEWDKVMGVFSVNTVSTGEGGRNAFLMIFID